MSDIAWTARPLAAVRGLIARALLPRHDAPESLGEITLWPHQRDALARLRAAIAEFGGALLADDVGLGKTFVALAVARHYRRPLVVVPAAIRSVWRGAAARAAVTVDLLSFEALSRGAAGARSPDLVIVDEAHHARNPATKRHAALAELVAGAHTLLLSATPIHNSRDDLVALLALFLGSRAAALDDAALARIVVRRSLRDIQDGPPRPRVDGPHPLVVATGDDEIPEAILALPPPLPAADAGSAHALLLVTMIRQWSSSAAALAGGIRRRLAVAHALDRSLAAGRHPTRAELAAWTLGYDAQQLAFAELLAPARDVCVRSPPLDALRDAVARHADALRALDALVRAGRAIDDRRAARVLDAWRAHPGERLLAFTQFAETVDAYWRALRMVPRVCALTASGGRVAGGSIARDEVLAMFSPGTPRASAARRVDAIVTTDLASEGLDLQRASVLVHLDLPWTAARLEQRLGRVRRPGASAPVVHVYTMEPPARASTLIAIRRRLAEKLAAARLALGDVMPDATIAGVALGSGENAAPALGESIHRRLGAWMLESSEHATLGTQDSVPVAAVVAAEAEEGWIALFENGGRALLVASIAGRTGDALAIVDAALAAAGGDAVPPAREQVGRALAAAFEWRDAHWGALLAGAEEVGTWGARRRPLADVAALAQSPRSRRAGASSAIRRARSVAIATLGAAEERRLLRLAAGEERGSAAWLDAVGALAHDRVEGGAPVVARPPALRALLLLVPR